jgi:hypothetical protein
MELLSYSPNFFFWAGSDLFPVTNENAQRQMIIIETNSCPSGQKSMPCEDPEENSGFHALIRHTFLNYVKDSSLRVKGGSLAVLFDKNEIEASGYAAVISEVMEERVY